MLLSPCFCVCVCVCAEHDDAEAATELGIAHSPSSQAVMRSHRGKTTSCMIDLLTGRYDARRLLAWPTGIIVYLLDELLPPQCTAKRTTLPPVFSIRMWSKPLSPCAPSGMHLQ